MFKQASDLHTSSFDQLVAYHYLSSNDQAAHLATIRRVYGERFDVLDRTLREAMPAGYSWTRPDGGMFLWLTGPECLDSLELLTRAVQHNVAFVPGRDFFPAGGGANFMRLNFSNSAPERIREGVGRLGVPLSRLARVQPASSASGRVQLPHAQTHVCHTRYGVRTRRPPRRGRIRHATRPRNAVEKRANIARRGTRLRLRATGQRRSRQHGAVLRSVGSNRRVLPRPPGSRCRPRLRLVRGVPSHGRRVPEHRRCAAGRRSKPSAAKG